MVEKIGGRKAKLKRFDRQKGDVRRTRASLDLAKKKLGYKPSILLEEGLTRQWEWISALGK
jgi:nucleoside-diphosphate-sugar epimerase